MRTRVAPYDKLPQHMYYKPASQEVIWSHSLYKPTPTTAPTGFTRVNWVISLNDTWINNVAQLFQPNHNELLPLPQSATEANPNLKQDYGY